MGILKNSLTNKIGDLRIRQLTSALEECIDICALQSRQIALLGRYARVPRDEQFNWDCINNSVRSHGKKADKLMSTIKEPIFVDLP